MTTITSQGRDLFTTTQIIRGTGVRKLEPGDLLYNLGDSTFRLPDPRTLTVVAVFVSGFAKGITPGTTTLNIQLGDGVAFDAPIIEATVESVDSRLNQNSLIDEGANSFLDSDFDYILTFRVPTGDTNFRAELYSDLSILGLVTIYDLPNQTTPVGRGAVVSIIRS